MGAAGDAAGTYEAHSGSGGIVVVLRHLVTHVGKATDAITRSVYLIYFRMFRQWTERQCGVTGARISNRGLRGFTRNY